MDSERELIYDAKSWRAGQPIKGQKDEKVEGKGGSGEDNREEERSALPDGGERLRVGIAALLNNK